jgi:hypothetical protein
MCCFVCYDALVYHFVWIGTRARLLVWVVLMLGDCYSGYGLSALLHAARKWSLSMHAMQEYVTKEEARELGLLEEDEALPTEEEAEEDVNDALKKWMTHNTHMREARMLRKFWVCTCARSIFSCQPVAGLDVRRPSWVWRGN